MNDGESEAPKAKEKFELLYGMLKDAYRGLIAYEFQQCGFLVVNLGWLMTSPDARWFISNHLFAPVEGTVLLGLLMYFHVKWVRRWKSKSEQAYVQLIALKYMPVVYLKSDEIRPFTLFSFSAIHIALALALIALGWTIYAEGPARQQPPQHLEASK